MNPILSSSKTSTHPITGGSRSSGKRLTWGFSLVAMTLLLGGSGCDKFPMPGTETPAPKPTPVAAPPVPVVQPPTVAPPKVVETPKPPPRTADDVIAEFLKIPPHERDDKVFQELASLDEEHRGTIQEINASASTRLSPAGLQAMQSFPNLKTVAINQVPVGRNNPMLEAISKLTHLETLSLQRAMLYDEDLAYLKPLQKLKYLVLDDTNVGDKCFQHLKHLKALERLDVNNNTNIDGSGFIQFGDPKVKHPGLKMIVANKTRFGQQGMLAIHRSKILEKSLEEIHAGQCYLSDPMLEGLALCQNLRVISIGFDTISDNGIALMRLKSKPKLEVFSLSNSEGITDNCLFNFRACRKLKTLRLTNTRVTQTGMDKLRKVMKNTEIVGP